MHSELKCQTQASTSAPFQLVSEARKRLTVAVKVLCDDVRLPRSEWLGRRFGDLGGRG